MDCKTGGFINHASHDAVRNLKASLLSEVCEDVPIESKLFPISRETFELRSTNVEHDAMLDVKPAASTGRVKLHSFILELYIAIK